MAVERRAGRITLWIILLAVGLFSIAPFLWIVAGSFKTHHAIQSGRIAPWSTYVEKQPDGTTRHVHDRVSFDNYSVIRTKLSGLPTYYFNTI